MCLEDVSRGNVGRSTLRNVLGLERCPVAKRLFCSYRDPSSLPGIHAGRLITAGDISSKRSKDLLQAPALERTHVCLHMCAHTCRTESFAETVTVFLFLHFLL